MPRFLFFCFYVLLGIQLNAQSFERKVVSSAGGYYHDNNITVTYTIGEPVITTLNTAGYLLTQGFQQPDSLKISPLVVKAFLQGSYQGGGAMVPTLFDLGMSTDPTATDSIEVGLWSQANLSNPQPDYIDKAILHSNGQVTAAFNEDVIRGKNYYIVLRHRNAIETWGTNPLDVINNNNYDFSTALVKAYSDGLSPAMQNLGDGNFGLYSGDVNQDGTVDGQDMNVVDNNTREGVFGYYNSDINGDGATDGLDMNVVDNNTRYGLFTARPY